MSFAPFCTTGIGSMPHRKPYEACETVLKYFDIPFWPQLPKCSPKESMIAQFAEGLPGIVFDSDKVFLKKDEELITEWLATYSDEMLSPISKEHAQGLYTFVELLKDKKLKIVKGQITGPVTFTLSLKDNDGRLIYFDETLREVALMHLKAKAKWQVDFLRKIAQDVIIFIDEPILQAVGTSAYISVQQHEAMRLISELVSSLKEAGITVGLHCCGRADWDAVLSSGIDILSFDAFFFFEFLKIYKEKIKNFLSNGGYIAWGFVPTTDDLRALKDEDIINQAIDKISGLANEIPMILTNSLTTPSCGMGSLEEQDALRVCNLVNVLKEKFLNG